jgi:hypothetical protein
MATKNKLIQLTILVCVGIVVTACYEKFDEDSFKPKFLIGGYSFVSEIEPASLVSYFPFDESLTDDATSEIANNKNTVLVNGFKGKAVSFDVEEKSYLTYDAGDVKSQMGSFTISFWVNPTFVDADASGSIDGIIGLVNISRPDDFWGYLDWFIENGANNSGATIKAHVVNSPSNGGGDSWVEVTGVTGLFGAWSSHTLTYDATTSTLKYYLNGSLKKTQTAGWTGPISFAGSGPMVFGAVHFQTSPTLSNHGSEPWASWLTGAMDEVRVYDKALTDEQVNSLVLLQGKGR